MATTSVATQEEQLNLSTCLIVMTFSCCARLLLLQRLTVLQCLLPRSVEHQFSSNLCSALQILRNRLLDEAEASVQLNAEVASNWGKLFRYCHKWPCNTLVADHTGLSCCRIGTSLIVAATVTDSV